MLLSALQVLYVHSNYHLRRVTARRVTPHVDDVRSNGQWFIGYGMKRVYTASQNLNSERKLHNAHAHAWKPFANYLTAYPARPIQLSFKLSSLVSQLPIVDDCSQLGFRFLYLQFTQRVFSEHAWAKYIMVSVYGSGRFTVPKSLNHLTVPGPKF